MAGAAFHSPANASLGCRQVSPLFAPLSCRLFAGEYFERRHIITRATPLHGLLSSDALELAASHWQFKVAQDHSQARLLKPDSFSHDEAWADGTLLDGAAMRRALAAKRTVVLHNVELYWKPLGQLALALMRAFGVYSQVNVYYAPMGLARAVHAHQDSQSVFIVQCEGRKTWELFEPPVRWRLRLNQRGKGGDVAPASELTQPVARVTLTPGDVLFLPRGMYHRTATTDEDEDGAPPPAGRSADDSAESSVASLHVTVGVETETDNFTWISLLRDAATTLGLPDPAKRLEEAQWHDERLREALPLALCRFGAAFAAADPTSSAWLSHARTLILKHFHARPETQVLAVALDDALRQRHEHVDAKREQLLDFVRMSHGPEQLDEKDELVKFYSAQARAGKLS